MSYIGIATYSMSKLMSCVCCKNPKVAVTARGATPHRLTDRVCQPWHTLQVMQVFPLSLIVWKMAHPHPPSVQCFSSRHEGFAKCLGFQDFFGRQGIGIFNNSSMWNLSSQIRTNLFFVVVAAWPPRCFAQLSCFLLLWDPTHQFNIRPFRVNSVLTSPWN